MGSSRGQATVEYVAALALLVCVFVGAAVAVAAPGIPRAVLAKLRLALCVVGGDICTSADAAARGLEPCLVSTERHDETGGVSFLVFRVGALDTWIAERRSDGTILLHNTAGSAVGATTGVGLKAFGVRLGGDASADLSFGSGRTWAVNEAQLRRIVERTGGDPSDVSGLDLEQELGPPTERYREGGGRAGATLGVEAREELPDVGAHARLILGRRTAPGGTTYYLDLGAAPAGSISELVPGLQASGRVAAEYRASEPPVLTLRLAGEGHGPETEAVLTLPLRTAADRAAARRVAFVDLDDAGLAVRDLLARIRARGTIERRRYATTEKDDGWDAGLALGAKLGADHHVTSFERRLIDAQVLGGPSPARREDCLPSG